MYVCNVPCLMYIVCACVRACVCLSTHRVYTVFVVHHNNTHINNNMMTMANARNLLIDAEKYTRVINNMNENSL